jgi:hypothetical protein
MRQERALKVVLVVVGMIFCGLAYPSIMFVKQAPALAMQFSVYVTLGIFLLLASRNPSESEPDRVHGIVVFRSRCGHGGYDIPVQI